MTCFFIVFFIMHTPYEGMYAEPLGGRLLVYVHAYLCLCRLLRGIQVLVLGVYMASPVPRCVFVALVYGEKSSRLVS